MNPRQVTYREFTPASAVRHHVACYWTGTAPAAGSYHRRILPDGCIDIIFDLSPASSPRATIVGTMTKPLLFQADSPLHLVAVRFQPGGAAPFLRFPADEITDSQVELPSARSADRLAERIQDEHSERQRIQRLESALLTRLAEASEIDRRVQTAVAMFRTPGERVETVAATVELSRQHLTRLFRRHVGIGPVQFARVVRLRRLLSHLRTAGDVNWPSAALDAGYYDQAHMISDCRSLTGQTPTELVRC